MVSLEIVEAPSAPLGALARLGPELGGVRQVHEHVSVSRRAGEPGRGVAQRDRARVLWLCSVAFPDRRGRLDALRCLATRLEELERARVGVPHDRTATRETVR